MIVIHRATLKRTRDNQSVLSVAMILLEGEMECNTRLVEWTAQEKYVLPSASSSHLLFSPSLQLLILSMSSKSEFSSTHRCTVYIHVPSLLAYKAKPKPHANASALK